MSLTSQLYITTRRSFLEHFGSQPALTVRAPGRVNLIGEHTDYNDGFVLPLAIDREVCIAARPRSDQRVRLHFMDFAQSLEFDLAELIAAPRPAAQAAPLEYLRGVSWVLASGGYQFPGFEAVIQGNVPIGAGLSSSAALEVATARLLISLADQDWQPTPMALAAQRAEREWVGVNCGIMDQLISAAGLAGQALLIDCRSLELSPAPIPAGLAVVVLDTNTRRGLHDSAYNERRAQCETAARFFNVPALRDVSLERFAAESHHLDALTQRRARHVVTENARTLAAHQALRAADMPRLGELLNTSHASLRDDFAVSSPALDAIVSAAWNSPGCYGARMTGAGFGGCALAVVAVDHLPAFIESVQHQYSAQLPGGASIYVVTPSAGASLLD